MEIPKYLSKKKEIYSKMTSQKKILNLIFILFIITPLFSQHQYGKGGKSMQGMIFGYVLDSLNQKPIEYASISLTSTISPSYASCVLTTPSSVTAFFTLFAIK